MTTPEHTGQEASGQTEQRVITISIDGKTYETRKDELTGDQIRHLVTPPIGHDRDLWLEGRDGLDKLIGNHEEVHLHNEMVFFTVPKVINPGGADVATR